MATTDQIAANIENATASTGPRTPEGKSRSSQNAVKTGLFSRSGYIRPDELPSYNAIHEAYWADLAPHGTLEENLVTEIIRAAWRLERCADVESVFLHERPAFDPMETDDSYSYRQNNVDRARAQSHRIIMRTLVELRRVQTERYARRELRHDLPRTVEGAASSIDLLKALNSAKAKITKQTQSPAAANHEIGRNTPCPCGSNQKYKRCCGLNAPPVLSKAA
jgi:hypothetical protein